MAVFSYNSMLIILFLIIPSFLTHEIDPDTKSFIQIICNQTRNQDTCESIFTNNLSDPKSDPLSLTRLAIEITSNVLHNNVGYLQSEKKNMKNFRDELKNNWDLLEICEGVYGELIKGVEEIKKEIEIMNSMIKVGESLGKLQKLANYEMVKCEKLVGNNNNGFYLLEELNLGKNIFEKNYNVELLIEIVVSAGENLVKVIDIGVDEVENHYGFLQFLFHG
ncbi:hypothetical protein RND81_04G133300 [Saponaria officinalis]|uniref:Pectinesterase inhibitor domain-containing protein n=1 Tax=Saponaria officinalis TaxID=3572 RepID=A0AAW1LKH9_SAPOF